MDEDVSFLGDLALENLLDELDVGSNGLEDIGIRGKKKANIGRNDIYNDNWDDDDDDDMGGKGKGRDWEKEVDEELKNQPDPYRPPAPTSNDKAYLAGLAYLNKNRPSAIPTQPAKPLAPPQPTPSPSFPSPAPSPFQLPIRVKEEPQPSSASYSFLSLPPAPRSPPKPPSVSELFPEFQKGKVLDFVSMFSDKRAGASRKERPTLDLSDFKIPAPAAIRPSSLINPLPPSPPHLPNVGPNLSKFLPSDWGITREDLDDMEIGDDDDMLRAALQKVEDELGMEWEVNADDPRGYDMVLMDDWESQIVFESYNPPPKKRQRPNELAPYNHEIESGDWVKGIIWDATRPPPPAYLGTVVEEKDDGPREVVQPVREQASTITRNAPTNLDPYNISNDHHYEGGKQRVRQTFGSIVVQHAWPALKLQLPFYKTSLTKQEARSWHRPALQFPANIKISFERVKPAKKMKDKVGRKLGKGGDIAEGLRKPGDLTLKDTSSFVLWEFSEEHPPLMSGFAMGSVLVNYYRKKSDDDGFIPRRELGEPFVLDLQDEPPYSTFAPIDPGQTQPTLYNNLIKAPLFQHQPEPTDFLVVRNTVKGVTSYYIREIKNLFVTGQTIPSMQVPGPHARKVSATAKLRTHYIAYKLLQKAKSNRMKLSKLMKFFPDTHELQMRQRLKDFLEFHRKGPHQQTWRLKPGLKFPEPGEYIKMLDPESLMLIESTQVGLQVLKDAGYGQSEKEEKEEDESKMDVQQLLAPWVMTKSYLHSQRDKAWVQLYGEAEPTGRGEGFSFIKVSMKELFLREHETMEERQAFVATLPKSQQKQGHVVQEAIFRAEARRIWDLQCASLSSTLPPELDEDEYTGSASASQATLGKIRGRDDSPAVRGRGRSPSAMSRGSSMDRDETMSQGSGRGMAGRGEGGTRVLRIKRLVKGEWTTQIVRDTNVINAYVRKRQMIEEKDLAAETAAPTGDAEKDKRMKKLLQEEIDKLKKNQHRRINRKKTIDETGVPKPPTSRRCANCGAVGHMKTNRKCPKWAEFNLAPQTVPTATGVAGLPLGGMGDFGAGFFDAAEEGAPKVRLQMNKPS